MKKVLIGNGGHAKEVMAQMGVKLDRFVDDEYLDEDTLPLSQFDPKKYIAMVAIAVVVAACDDVWRPNYLSHLVMIA